MTEKQADILLLLGIAARSSSYVFAKIGLATLEPWNLLGIRFTLAFGILCLLFYKRLSSMTKETWIASGLLGFVLFACMTCETISLQTIDSSMAAFLENTAVLWVLCLEALLFRRLPDKVVILAAITIICGIFLLTMHGTVPSFSIGAAICLTGSVFYAVWILLTSKFARKLDPVLIGIFQMGFIGLFSLSGSLFHGTLALPTQPIEWEVILALVLICSVFGFTLQPIAQKYTSAEKAGLFTAMNPLIAAFLGWSILAETLGIAQLIGGALIIGSIIAVQLRQHSQKAAAQPTRSPSSY